jgi:two-component system heavy metal sensor histidine kinase CusS
MSWKNAPDPAAVTPHWSLATRLTAWYTGSAFCLILLATGFLYWVLVTNLDREDDEFLADKVHFLRVLLRDRPEDATALKQEAEWEWAASQYAQFSLRILDEGGSVVVETPGLSGRLPPAVFPDAVLAGAEPDHGIEWRSAEGKSYRLLAAQAAGPTGGRMRVLQVALDRSYEEDLLNRYRRNLWLVVGLALVVCAVVGHRIAQRGLRPIVAITATARRIRSTTLDKRILADSLPNELFVLAATFNEMLDRLQEAFDRLARFSADIAHELRTPLNNLRGEAEVALGKPRSPEEYREALGSCLEEGERLSRMIDSLLFLARADSPEARVAHERVDVGRELETVRIFYEAGAAEAGVTLTVTADGAVAADLDRTLLQRAIGNLVANALAHTPSGGEVTLSAKVDGNQVYVEVSDTGSGIPPEHLPHVFDRFYRVDQARSTASGRVGLGLAIVKSIAALHRGSVQITSEVGKGTCVRLGFPAARTA